MVLLFSDSDSGRETHRLLRERKRSEKIKMMEINEEKKGERTQHE